MSENGRQDQAHRREFVGEVVSNKMQKTVVVVVKRFVRHHRYGKVLRRVTRLKAHDEKNECQIGDRVRLVEADRKSTRLNSSHSQISYAVFCLKKKKKKNNNT